VASTWFFTVILTDLLRRSYRGRPAAASAPAPLWRSLAALPTDYGVLCLVFLLLAAHEVFRAVYGLMLLGTTLFFAAALVAWFRELSLIERPAPVAEPAGP
jgi:hypothetical protein